MEKAQRYGPEIMQFITTFCEENSLKTDIVPAEVEVEARVGVFHVPLDIDHCK